MPLVLLGDEEPNELGVGHLALPLRGAARHRAREYAIDHPRRDGCRRENVTQIRNTTLYHFCILAEPVHVPHRDRCAG